MKYIVKICYGCDSRIIICKTLKDALNVISENSYKNNTRKITLKRLGFLFDKECDYNASFSSL